MSTLAEQVVEQLKTDMDNVYDAGYQKGLKEVGGLDVSKFGIQNEVKGTNIVTCDYVNENEHNVEVKLSSDTVTDFSGVEVKIVEVNLLDYMQVVRNYESRNYENVNGYHVTSLQFKPNTTYYIKVNGTRCKWTTFLISTQQSVNGSQAKSVGISNTWNSENCVTTDETGLIYFGLTNSPTGEISRITQSLQDALVQIETGMVVTPYAPYTETTYTANADGTVDGVTSISPVMNIICDTENVDITAKYYCVQDVEWHRFWDNYQEFGERTHYEGAFAGIGWNKENLKPKYQITPINAQRMFYGSAITDMKTFCETNDIIIDFSQITTNGMLSYLLENSLIEIFIPVDVSGLPKLTNIFRGASNLKVAELVGVNTNQEFDAVYAFCSELREVYIDGVVGKNIALNNSALLSEGSIQRVIDVLADLTGQATQTLTLHADVKAKLTEEQIATITSKNWTLA